MLGFLSHLITCFVVSYLEGSDGGDAEADDGKLAQSGNRSRGAVPPADTTDVRAALDNGAPSANGASPTGSAAAASSAGGLNLSASAATPAAPRSSNGATPVADATDAAASAAPSFGGAAAAQGADRDRGGAERPTGRSAAQVLEERVRALGPGEPGGGWRGWGGQTKPDWLTIEEPVFVRRNRAVS